MTVSRFPLFKRGAKAAGGSSRSALLRVSANRFARPIAALLPLALLTWQIAASSPSRCAAEFQSAGGTGAAKAGERGLSLPQPELRLPEGSRAIRNLAYAPDGNPFHTGDLYLPPARLKNHAGVVVVHGGAWIAGSKTDRAPMAMSAELLQHGYTVFSVNYRLVGKGGEFPADVQDVKDALAFFMTHALEWDVSPNRVAIGGDSAGAHLALLAAYAPTTGQFAAPHHPGWKGRPAAVVDLYGPTSASAAPTLTPLQRDILLNYLGRPYSADPVLYHRASPIDYARTAVPTLLVHGTRDPLVPVTQSEMLDRALHNEGILVRLVEVPGVGHGFVSYPIPARTTALQAMVSFLRQALFEPAHGHRSAKSAHR